MNDYELDAFLEECKADFGFQLKTSRHSGDTFYNVEIPRRLAFFEYFLERLRDEHGKDKSFYSTARKKFIVKSCGPKGPQFESETKGWFPAAMSNLNIALTTIFPSNKKYEPKKEFTHEPSPEPTFQEPTPQKEEPTSAKAKMLKDCDDSDYDWSKAPVWDPEKHERETGEEPIEDILDPEMAELLGYNRKK